MKFHSDKIKHFAACAIISFATSAFESALGARYLNSWLAGYIAGMAIGVGKEYGDKCAVGNRWDWADIGADALGSVVGASLGSLISIIHN